MSVDEDQAVTGTLQGVGEAFQAILRYGNEVLAQLSFGLQAVQEQFALFPVLHPKAVPPGRRGSLRKPSITRRRKHA